MNNDTIEFVIRSKRGESEISGFVYVDEIDDEAPLHFYDQNGLECGTRVPSNPFSENTSYDLHMDYENISSEFQSDDMFLQILFDARDENTIVDRGEYIIVINEGFDMELVSVEKIGNRWGDNLLFTFHVPNLEKIPWYILEDGEIDRFVEVGNEKYFDFEWSHYESYDNMDINGHFFETVFIDKDDSFHKMEGDKVVFTDDSIIDFIKDDIEPSLRRTAWI